MRVGRHADVVRSNQLAAKADEDYIAQCRAQGMYPLGYYPHNLHFIWMGATAAGRASSRSTRRTRGQRHPDEALGSSRSSRVSSWCPTGRWSVSSGGTHPRGQGAALADRVHERRLALRTRDGLIGKDDLAEAEAELASCRRCSPIRRSKGQTTFSTNNGGGDPADRSRSDRRGDRREAQGLGQGAAAPRARRALRGCARLSGTADWHSSGASEPRVGAAAARAARTKQKRCTGKIWKNPGNVLDTFGLLQAQKAQGKRTRPRSRKSASSGVEGLRFTFGR